ncbi:hypothetical protein N8940_00975 [Sphingomonadaceae bacterium]|nr:hypothetical protein [Sphingomonadaceae bacterium]
MRRGEPGRGNSRRGHHVIEDNEPVRLQYQEALYCSVAFSRISRIYSVLADTEEEAATREGFTAIAAENDDLANKLVARAVLYASESDVPENNTTIELREFQQEADAIFEENEDIVALAEEMTRRADKCEAKIDAGEL